MTTDRWIGTWWRSDQPEDQAHGELTWTERARLEIHPGLAHVPMQIRGDEVHRYPAIHGLTADGKQVTLLDCMSVRRNIGMIPVLGVQSEVIASNCLLIGAHLEPDVLFEEARFEVPGLEQWLPQAHLDQTFIGAEGGFECSVRVNAPPDEQVEVPGVGTVSWKVHRHLSGIQVPVATIRTSTHIGLRPAEPENLEWYLTQWNRIATLLTFAWGSMVGSRAVVAKGDGTPVEIRVKLSESGPCPHAHRNEFFLPKSAPDFDFNAVLQSWLQRDAVVDMPARLARSVLSAEHGWVHTEFLSLMQALEGFHRALYPGSYMAEQDYQEDCDAMIRAMPARIAGDHRTSLKNRLRYGNQISLRRRLKDLCDSLPPDVLKLVLGGRTAPPPRWVTTRNYYTHWDEESRADILDDQELAAACLRLRVLLSVLYLHYAEVPEGVLIKALCGTSPLAQHLIHLNSIEIRRRDPTSRAGVLAEITPAHSGQAPADESDAESADPTA
jgi:hypothetical protein